LDELSCSGCPLLREAIVQLCDVEHIAFSQNNLANLARKQPFDCFLRTRMDVLVIGETILLRQNES
jgi:hypothetical protein